MKENFQAQLLSDLIRVLKDFDNRLSDYTDIIQEHLNDVVNDENIKGTPCKKECKEEVIKEPDELTLGEVLVIEALSRNFIPKDTPRDEIIPEIMKTIASNPLINLMDGVAMNVSPNGERRNFAMLYCQLMSDLLGALNQVDISKLRVK